MEEPSSTSSTSSTSGENGHSIELPAPTAWPMALAFGVALAFTGLATSGILTAIGALLVLAGAVGWFTQVLPHPAHERVAVTDEVFAVRTSRPEIERVGIAMDQVRVVLPVEFYPVSAGIRGGLAGGVAMAILATVYGVSSGHGIWYPINLLAAGFFPSASIAELSAFHPSAFAIAVAIHLITSVLVGVLYGAMLPMLPRRPILLGGLIGPLLWSGLLHSSLALINPVLAARIDWWWFIVSQVGFGVVAGIVVSRRQRVATQQPLPFSLRAGIEASGFIDETTGKGPEHE
jgi:hypothetical protein